MIWGAARRNAALSAATFLLAVLLGVTAGVFISGYWLSEYLPANSRLLAILTMLGVAGACAGYYALLGALIRSFSRLSAARRASAVVLGAMLGPVLLLAGTSGWQSANQYVTLLLPKHEFGISTVGAPAGTELVWLSTSLGDISYDSLRLHGWVRRGDVLRLESPDSNQISGSAATGDRLSIVLESEQAEGIARIRWDGSTDSLTIDRGKTSYEHTFGIPWYASGRFLLALGLTNFALVALGLVLAAWRLAPEWLRQIDGDRTAPSFHVLSWECALVVATMALALLLRAFNLGAVFPAVDEYYHLIAARQILNGAALGAVYSRSLWLVTLPVSIALRLFGPEVWAARGVGVLFNALAIWPLYLVTRKIGRPVAVVSSLLFATSPWIITFARIAREYAYYPFYFYWIILVMIALVERIPAKFKVVGQWRKLLQGRTLLLAALLVLPPIFALKVDSNSTFRTILIAYLVFGIFIVMRFDWRERTNWPFLALAAAIILGGGRLWFSEQLSKLWFTPRLNTVPLEYFFPNPQQQWYFDRAGVIVVVALMAAIIGAFALVRRNWIPLFFVVLFFGYWMVFVFFSKSFFHTRHLMSTEMWYVVVVAMGLTWLWQTLRQAIPWSGRVVSAFVGLGLGLLVLNPWQIVLPSVWKEPNMPISEDYMHDMSSVQRYMLEHVQGDEALISTVYGLYATWRGEPDFSAQDRINSHTTSEEIEALVQAHSSGWIVIDRIRLDLSPYAARDITNLPQIEYIGVFDDEYVWRWE